MDCEKFDQVVLGLLYEELDDLSHSAAKRHTEHCTRCRDLAAGLAAARSTGAMPLVDPPDDLELRILSMERRARSRLPLRQRLGRLISWLAGYSMRPQLAMAALLMLVIGASLFLLRARPGEQKSVFVTERGVPESERETVAVVPVTEAPSGRKSARRAPEEPDPEPARNSEHEAQARGEKGGAGDEPAPDDDADQAYQRALTAYRDRRYDEALERFQAVAERGGQNAPSAALYAAQSVRASSGCGTASPAFVQVYERYSESSPGKEAAWQAASCYRTLGDFDRARKLYEALSRAPGYTDRAQAALASLGDGEVQELAASRSEVESSTPRAKAKPAAMPSKASKPAAGATTGPRPSAADTSP